MKRSKKTRIILNIVFVVFMLALISVSAFMWLDMARYNRTGPQAALNQQDAPSDPEASADASDPEAAPVQEAKSSYTQDDIEVRITGASMKAGDGGNNAVTLSYTITNHSDSAFGYSNAGWRITLPDGNSIDPMSYVADFNPRYVSPEEAAEDSLTFEVAGSTELTEVTAVYLFTSYGDEVLFDASKVIVGEMTEDEFKAAHDGIMEMKFKLKMK